MRAFLRRLARRTGGSLDATSVVETVRVGGRAETRAVDGSARLCSSFRHFARGYPSAHLCTQGFTIDPGNADLHGKHRCGTRFFRSGPNESKRQASDQRTAAGMGLHWKWIQDRNAARALET